MVICMVFCIDSVAGIMPIITCPGCNSTNTRFCHEKGFVENTRFCRKTGFIANTRLFGFVWCRLLRRHLGFDSDFAQISGLKIGGWHLWEGVTKKKLLSSWISCKLCPPFPTPQFGLLVQLFLNAKNVYLGDIQTDSSKILLT